MCTNSKIIYNRYIDDYIRVNCGKCPACQKEKSNRLVTRIKDTNCDGLVCLFVTLTYAPAYLPYIRRSSLQSGVHEVVVLRDAVCRYVKVREHKFSLHRRFGTVCVERFPFYVPVGYDIQSLRHAEGSNIDNIGVVYYKDLQDFFKRLKIDLFRNYGYDTSENFITFQCAEYGPSTQRPHFHLLLWIDPCHETDVRTSICKNWPYADRRRTAQYIEIAREAASYVSSYCNRPSDFPSVFRSGHFRQRHSFSKALGFNNAEFSLHQIIDKIYSGRLQMHREVTCDDGTKSSVAVPVPKYVISRYFPYVKGFANFSRYTDRQCFRLIALHPRRFIPFFEPVVSYKYYDFSVKEDLPFGNASVTGPDGELLECGSIYPLDPDDETLHTIIEMDGLIPSVVLDDYHLYWVRFYNAYQRCKDILGGNLTYADYCDLYWDCWHCYHMTHLALWYEHQIDFDSIVESYEYPDLSSNDLDVYLYKHGFDSFILRRMILSNPNVNTQPLRVKRSNRLTYQFERSVKQRKVVNSVMSQSHFV